MRFKHKEKKSPPKPRTGEFRTRRFFAILPITVDLFDPVTHSLTGDKETRWLEMVTVMEYYYAPGDEWRPLHFKD